MREKQILDSMIVLFIKIVLIKSQGTFVAPCKKYLLSLNYNKTQKIYPFPFETRRKK